MSDFQRRNGQGTEREIGPGMRPGMRPGIGSGTIRQMAGRPGGPLAGHSLCPGNFFQPPPPRTPAHHLFDFINPDCRLLGKMFNKTFFHSSKVAATTPSAANNYFLKVFLENCQHMFAFFENFGHKKNAEFVDQHRRK